MHRIWQRGRSLMVAALCLATLTGTMALGRNGSEPGNEEKKPAGPQAPLTVPEGTPEEKLEFLTQLKEKRPDAQNRDELLTHYKRVFGLIATTTRQLLEQPLDESLKTKALTARLEALGLLGRLGDANAAAEAKKMAGELKGHKDKQLAEAAQTLLLQLSLVELLEGERNAEQARQLVADLKDYLAGTPGVNHLRTAMTVAQMLEQAGQYEPAREAHQAMRERFLKTGDPSLMAAVEEFSRTAQKRLATIGKPMDLAGTLLDGQPLDWAKYKGKVVLVDFWATWCGPCVAELPNVKENYVKYHDRGFEVLGISLDEDRQALERFVKANELPWATLFSDDPKQNQALADRYGVSGIPALFLVDRDGKVITLQARGEDLGRQLEKLLGAESKTQ